jgi:hypothetical protein
MEERRSISVCLSLLAPGVVDVALFYTSTARAAYRAGDAAALELAIRGAIAAANQAYLRSGVQVTAEANRSSRMWLVLFGIKNRTSEPCLACRTGHLVPA